LLIQANQKTKARLFPNLRVHKAGVLLGRISFFCLTVASFTPDEPAPELPDLLRRIDALLTAGGDVLLFRQRELYHMTALVNRHTQAPVRFAAGLSLAI
jgi:hypothetical protein